MLEVRKKGKWVRERITSVSRLEDENEEKLLDWMCKEYGSAATAACKLSPTLSLLIMFSSPRGHPIVISCTWKRVNTLLNQHSIPSLKWNLLVQWCVSFVFTWISLKVLIMLDLRKNEFTKITKNIIALLITTKIKWLLLFLQRNPNVCCFNLGLLNYT